MYITFPSVDPKRMRLWMVLLVGICACMSGGCRKEEQAKSSDTMEILEHPNVQWNTQALTGPPSLTFKPSTTSPTRLIITENLIQNAQGNDGEKLKVTTQRDVILKEKGPSVIEGDGTLFIPLELTETRVAMNPRPGTWEDNTALAINHAGLNAKVGLNSVSVEPRVSSKPGIEMHVEQFAFNLGLLLPSQPPADKENAQQWTDTVGWKQNNGERGIEVARTLTIEGTQPCGKEKKETCNVVRIQLELKADTKQKSDVRSISSLSPSPDQWDISFTGSGTGDARVLLSPTSGVPLQGELNYTFKSTLSGNQNGTAVAPIEQSRSIQATLNVKGTTTQ